MKPHPHKRVTMRQIAHALGVSHATVSLALAGNPRIPAARRAEVKKIAEEMGYRPDPMLAALLHYRHATRSTPIQAALAWLNTWPDPKELRRFREFDDYWKGASQLAEEHGYRLEEFRANSARCLSRIEGVLAARNIQGVLLPPPPRRSGFTPDSIDWSKFSAVCFGHSYESLPLHVVTADQPAAGRLAIEKATALGYRKVGFVTDNSSTRRTLFSAGYLQAQMLLPASRQIPILNFQSAEPAPRLAQLRAWLKKFTPDAVVTDLSEARGLIETIGPKIPADIGLVALSVLDGNADAGINQNPIEIGRAAAETVISLINHNQRGLPRFQRQILVEGFWTDGKTLPKKIVSR